MDLTKIFRWRSRVKTGAPSVAGGAIESLGSHVTDINAHPDYLKKGSAVPTGQEELAIARHALNPIAHARNDLRRAEALRTKAQYELARDTDYVMLLDNFLTAVPQPHIVTAYVLNQILSEFVTADKLREMVKHVENEAVGDGSQLIYVGTDGYVRLSDKTIGGVLNPVWLKEGVITAFVDSLGGPVTPIYLLNGVFTQGTECAPREAPNLKRKLNEGKTEEDVPTSCTPNSDDPGTMIATKQYVDDAAEGSKVHGTVGSAIKPIWLDNGTFKPISGPIGATNCPVYVNDNGEFKRITGPIGGQYQPVYIDDQGCIQVCNLQIPVNGCYINTDGTDPATQLGYGTWKQIAEIGSLGFIWARTE